MRLNNLKILVTGGRGYIGSHTVKSLLAAGANVYIIDNRYVKQNKVDGSIAYITSYDDFDILDRLEKIGIDGVVHCAGTSLVGPSVNDPGEYYNNNVIKTIRMLDHLRQWRKIPFIVFSSSAAVYGEPDEIPIRESSITMPVNPYGNTKMMIERALRDFDVAYGMKHYSFRYFNAAGADVWDHKLGPEPNDTHIIPRMFEAYFENKPFKLYGDDYNTKDGTCVRDYIHVCDIALAHLRACVELSEGSDSKTYNIGTNQGYSNKEIIDAFREYVGNLKVEVHSRRPGDPDVLVADATNIQKDLNWKPNFSDLETIMKSFKEYYQNENN